MSISLVKGQKLSLKKADGTSISKIRVGASWDVGTTGADVDLFVVNTAKKTLPDIAFFNNKEGIKGIKLGADNRTGEGEGDDETVEMDATQSEDGNYAICLNIYDTKGGTLDFSKVANLKISIYNAEDNSVLATYNVTETGGAHTGFVAGIVTDSGNDYTFQAKGDFVNGNIEEIAAAL